MQIGVGIGIPGILPLNQRWWPGGASLAADFVNDRYMVNGQEGAFADFFTFTRASSAYRVNESGLLESVATDVARFDHDPLTGARRGFLIEESRTNSALQSESLTDAFAAENVSFSANATTAPDGAATADKMVSGTGSVEWHRANQGSITVTNTTHTLSIWVKAAGHSHGFIDIYEGDGSGFSDSFVFNLDTGTAGSSLFGGIIDSTDIEEWPDGWYRVWVVFTPAAGSQFRFDPGIARSDGIRNQFEGNGTDGLYYWGWQVEAGAFPTSYIKTTSASATRAADVASLDTLTPWFNADEGTLFMQGESFDTLPSAGNDRFVSLDDGTSNERMALSISNDARAQAFVQDGGSVVVDLQGAVVNQNVFKAAFAYKADDFALSVNGNAVLTDTSGTLPTVDTLQLGGTAGGTSLSGLLSRVSYYPRRLPNATLQALSA